MGNVWVRLTKTIPGETIEKLGLRESFTHLLPAIVVPSVRRAPQDRAEAGQIGNRLEQCAGMQGGGAGPRQLFAQRGHIFGGEEWRHRREFVVLLQLQLHLHLEEMAGERKPTVADPFAQDVEIRLEKTPKWAEPMQIGPRNELGEHSVGSFARRIRQRRNRLGKIG